MTSVWVESLGDRFDRAFDLLDAAVRDCTNEVWQASMWQVADEDERYGTPWGVAWHALERLDFLLTGGFAPWEIWPPLSARLAAGTAAAQPAAPGTTGHTGLDLSTLSPPWTKSDVLDYSAYCRQRAVDALRDVTDERAATVVGRKTYAARLMQAYDHVVEHAAQIRQFITDAGGSP